MNTLARFTISIGAAAPLPVAVDRRRLQAIAAHVKRRAMQLQKVSIKDKFARFSETWSPKIVGELSGFHVKLVRPEGEFVWHHHDVEDELFLVVDGSMDMHYRDDGQERVERFGAGEFLIVPHGVEHKPVAALGTTFFSSSLRRR